MLLAYSVRSTVYSVNYYSVPPRTRIDDTSRLGFLTVDPGDYFGNKADCEARRTHPRRQLEAAQGGEFTPTDFPLLFRPVS